MADIVLVKSPFKGNPEHTIAFTSYTQQRDYFLSLNHKSINNISTIKEHLKSLRIDLTYSQAKNYDYLMYMLDGETKYKYAFIKEVKYIQEDCTEIIYEPDYIQTYLFDYNVGSCFVEREHVKDDTIGLHTIPENLQLGEYVHNFYKQDENLEPADGVIVGSTMYYKDENKASFTNQIGAKYGGIYSGVRYYYFHATTSSGTSGITSFLQMLADDGKIDAVSSMFLAPKFLFSQTSEPTEGPISPFTGMKEYDVIIGKQKTLNGYTPKNNKLLTFPYNYLLVDNGTGGNAEYHYEDFKQSDGTIGDNCNFKVIGTLTPGCSIRMIPEYYKGTNYCEVEGINLGKFPQCNWATDQFTNWLTQNGVNIATQIAGAGISIAGGVASGGVGLAVAGGSIMGVANTMAEIYKASRIPPQTSGNVNSGDIITSSGANTFHFYGMSIRKEYAQSIDEYFSKYGYKVNRVKTPNKNHRSCWWYTKTMDTRIYGDIPVDAIEKIRELYENGITFWANPSTFMNYTMSNNIINQ